MAMNIALGAMMHESNTFAPGRTTLDNFKNTEYLGGAAIIEAHRDRRSELGAMLSTLGEAEIRVVPILSAWAMPSPLVERSTYEQLKTQLIRGLKENAHLLDGILLTLHGSMTVEQIEDPEGDLLKSIRDDVPEVKYLVATLDHHANVTQAMVRYSDVLVGYRTHPHVDQYEVGAAAAGHLIDLIKQRTGLTKSFIKLPLITPAENRTEPINELRAAVERIEADPKVVTCSFFVGYPWADVSIQGASVLVITRDDRPLASQYAKQLADTMWNLRADFRFPIHSAQEAVRIGLSCVDQPIVLDELCDCTLGGSSGDAVSTIRYCVEQGIKGTIAVGIVDPESVATAVNAGVGSSVHLSIGGKVCQTDNPPLVFDGTVSSVNEDVAGESSIHSGYETPLGKIAVVANQGIEIILIERAGKIAGPSFLEALGIDPKAKKFIIVKEGLNPLEMYKAVAAQILMVDSPGFDRQILRPEDYQNVRRPIYPFDPDMSWG